MDRNSTKTILMLVLVVASRVAFANEGHAAEHSAGLDEHTIKTIIYQAINVGALIVGLVYFLRTPVQNFFKNKKEAFTHAASKAQAARRIAEEEKMQIQVRLNKLESTSDESLSRARADAAELRNQLLAEAELLSKRLREEAQAAAKLEVEKAKNHLREQMIKESSDLARSQMDQISIEIQQRLQDEFVDNVQAVRA